MANQETEEIFEFNCCVRGYHVTEKHWNDIAIGEGLIVCHEENNKHDPCAMAVYREHGPDNDNINVGHIPIELSSSLCFFVNTERKLKRDRKPTELATWNKAALKSLLLFTARFPPRKHNF